MDIAERSVRYSAVSRWTGKLTVALSRVFIIFSTSCLGPTIQPSRDPGATHLENESIRKTRPSVSMLKKVGTMGDAAPLGRI